MDGTRGHPRPGDDVRPESPTLDATQIAALYVDHGDELRRFVLGVVRDPELAADVLQATFAKAIQRGHTARAESLKGWLFRVALNEALAQRRRRLTGEEVTRRLAVSPHTIERPEDCLVRGETVEQVRKVLTTLPADQRRVVQMRFHEEKTFAQIAKELGVPLGTVLTRMRLALVKLRRHLREED